MSNLENMQVLSFKDKDIITDLVRNKDYKNVTVFLKEHSDYDISFTDEQGNTILHYLIKECNKDIDNGHVLPLAQMLLNMGLSHNAVNQNFKTPLDYAIEKSNAPMIGLFKGFPVYID